MANSVCRLYGVATLPETTLVASIEKLLTTHRNLLIAEQALSRKYGGAAPLTPYPPHQLAL